MHRIPPVIYCARMEAEEADAAGMHFLSCVVISFLFSLVWQYPPPVPLCFPRGKPQARYQAQMPDVSHWQPSALLLNLAERGDTVSNYYAKGAVTSKL